MNVCVIGLGYIGLPTAALMAGKGLNVTGVDINKDTVAKVNSGKIHIIEPDLEGLVRNVVDKGLLKADTSPCEADIFVIAVPTPFKKQSIDDRLQTTDIRQSTDDRQLSTVDQRLSTKDYRPTSDLSIPTPDISYVESAIKSIIPYLKEGNLIIIESTSPVGTTEKMMNLINSTFENQNSKSPLVHMAYCPERVLPGKVIYELENNDRVIGGINPESTEIAFNFYNKFVKGTLHKTDSRTAEMCKLSENAYRDVNIAFANELSIICDKAGIDVYELIKLTNRHPRVNILNPGCGVGGHCIAVDPWFIVSDFPEEARLINQARVTNDYKPEFVIEKIKQTIDDGRQSSNDQRLSTIDYRPVVVLLGLSFKPDIDDLRESPAMYIAKRLISDGINIIAVEPNVKKDFIDGIRNVDLVSALNQADIVVLLVAHKEFKDLKFNKTLLSFCRSV